MKKARPVYEEMKKKAKELSTPEKKYGVGISVSIYNANDDGADESASNIELLKDGSVMIYNTWEDHGQGADIGTVGTCLLYTSGLVPTYAGERCYACALEVSERMERWRAEMEDIAAMQKNRLRVGVIRNDRQYFLPQSIERFKRCV